MELQASSTDDVASNSGSDGGIAVFDTDLPAEHNVSSNFCVYWFSVAVMIMYLLQYLGELERVSGITITTEFYDNKY